MTHLCPVCANLGFYFDPQCNADECAHRERVVVDLEVLTPKQLAAHQEPERTTRTIPRVMDCPPRACLCPCGDDLRRVHRARARRQEQAFGLSEGGWR